MRIGIDARLINETGIGRYIRNLIAEFARIDSPHTFVLFLGKKEYGSYVLPNATWEKRLADVHWHTVSEQLIMPGLFSRAKLDLVHIPYFNVPIFSTIPSVVTIHDLTVLHHATGKATTLPYFLYFLKWIGYQLVLRVGLSHAKHIIAVSKTVKEDVMKSLGIPGGKITVTYEGVDKQLQPLRTANSDRDLKIKLREPYLLYVGNAYPHKNVYTLVRAFELFKRSKQGKNYSLVLVGSDTFFYKRLYTWIQTLSCKEDVIFTGAISDESLVHAYTYAKALVFPSLSEGFGLPALEALRFGCPVVCSDIPIFHEILDGHATYFDPKSPDSLANVLQNVSFKTQASANDFLAHYSWTKMAKETLRVYGSMKV